MRLGLTAILALWAVTLCGCGGGGSSKALTISPATASLSRGETQTFTIAGTGSPTAAVDGLRLNWSCTGGSLSMKQGLSIEFTAGSQSGYYVVTASDGNLSGYASVSVW